MTNDTPQRYSAIWVTLHWVIALLILAVLSLGLATRYVSAELWPMIVRWHMPLGILILLLMIVRVIVRSRSPHPEPATAGNPLLDKVGVITHYLLYIFAFLMPLSGLGVAGKYNLLQDYMAPAANLLGFLAPFHRLIAFGLAGLITLHIGAAFYHQLIRKDNLLSRMWYEK